MSDKHDETGQTPTEETERDDAPVKGAKKDPADGTASKRKKGAAGGSGKKGVPSDKDEAKGEPDAEAESEDGATDGSEAEEGADPRYMRLAADFQNYKKRTEKEKSDIYAFANAKFATDLLEVLDNFDRAVDRDASEGADAKFLAGMDMIRAQLSNVLKKNDVEEITAEGEVFDPNVHHAVMMEASDEYESGRVTSVLQKGYRLKDRVLRPAMVKVAE
ncbi:MAG: nucleotide exchange factor GrpE [Clostridiales Family XIII bacterium]|jgi:molecular chaperone GrpE|nr:nucleotide exchange factor GrpE [Clostridiales Family XIII bacterium]